MNRWYHATWQSIKELKITEGSSRDLLAARSKLRISIWLQNSNQYTTPGTCNNNHWLLCLKHFVEPVSSVQHSIWTNIPVEWLALYFILDKSRIQMSVRLRDIVVQIFYGVLQAVQKNVWILGNKRPTRCNRLVFYCETYCLRNMFRAPLCPSSGALELYRWLLPVVLDSLVYRSLVWCGVVGYVSSIPQTGHNPQLHTRQTTCIPKSQVPQGAAICITLELLMMSIMVTETCCANNKFHNKKPICCI
jgi:hypothetical protein